MTTIAPLGKYRALDDNGDPLGGGKLYTYVAGTSTPKDTYTTAEGDVANSNPVILDADGYADIWLGEGYYKFVLDDASDVNIFTVDNIRGDSTGGFAGTVVNQATNLTVTTVYGNNLINCTSSLTLSLLTSASAGNGFVFVVKNSSSGDVTIDPDGSELINGQSTLVIPAGLSTTVVSTGTGWLSFNYTGEILAQDNTFSGDNTFSAKVSYPDSGELTIASGAITPTGVFHTIDTEADASSDDLDTISGGVDGQVLILRQEDDARDVTITEAGNIVLPESTSVSLRDTKDTATFVYDGALSKWVAVSVPMSAVADASETVKGVVEIATDAEVKAETGTGGTGAVLTPTPENMKHHEGIAKAWVNFDGTGTVSIRDSYNVSSITDNGVGDYTINFTNAFANANYNMVGGGCRSTGYASFILNVRYSDPLSGTPTQKTTTACRVLTSYGAATAAYDIEENHATFYGDI